MRTQIPNIGFARIDVSHGALGMPPGSTGWAVGASLTIACLFNSGVAQAQGKVRLHFSSPQPVSGLLYLESTFSDWPTLTTSTGDTTLDLNCDGVPEHGTRTRRNQPLEIPVTLDATGLDLCFDINLDGSLVNTTFNYVSGNLDAYWFALFVPNTYGLERFGSGCAVTQHERIGARGYAPTLYVRNVSPGPQVVIGAFLLGFADQRITLPFAPNCELWVANPVTIVPTTTYVHGILIELPHHPLAPGIDFRIQGIYLDTNGHVMAGYPMRSIHLP